MIDDMQLVANVLASQRNTALDSLVSVTVECEKLKSIIFELEAEIKALKQKLQPNVVE